MKKTNISIQALCGLALFAVQMTARAQWEYYPIGDIYDVALQPDGQVAYAINSHVIHRGDAGGTSWGLANLPVPAPGHTLRHSHRTVSVAPSGAVFLSAATDESATSAIHINLWGSTDAGETWEAVFTTPLGGSPGHEGTIMMTACDALENVFLVSAFRPSQTTTYTMRIRKGWRDAGTGSFRWSIVSDHAPKAYLYQPESLAVASLLNDPGTPHVFVAGRAYDSRNTNKVFPFVRRSTDGGDTWTNAGSWEVPSGFSVNYRNMAIGIDPAGVVYLSVAADRKSGKTLQRYWLTYRSLNAGNSWSLMDTFLAGGSSGPSDLIVDAYGTVFVVGDGVVRAGADVGTSWVSAALTGAFAAASDTVGTVLVTGDLGIHRLPPL